MRSGVLIASLLLISGCSSKAVVEPPPVVYMEVECSYAKPLSDGIYMQLPYEDKLEYLASLYVRQVRNTKLCESRANYLLKQM